MSGARVLIVDDEPNIVVALEVLLDLEGWRVEVARDGEEANQRLEGGGFDVVLLDVMLPGLDGYEICRRLRAERDAAEAERPRIVLLTAKGREADRVRGLDCGCDLYITKPFSTRELVARLRQLVAEDTVADD